MFRAFIKKLKGLASLVVRVGGSLLNNCLIMQLTMNSCIAVKLTINKMLIVNCKIVNYKIHDYQNVIVNCKIHDYQNVNR